MQIKTQTSTYATDHHDLSRELTRSAHAVDAFLPSSDRGIVSEAIAMGLWGIGEPSARTVRDRIDNLQVVLTDLRTRIVVE